MQSTNKQSIAITTVFILLLITGGTWLSLVRFLPSGIPSAIAIVGVGSAFAFSFVWLLVRRIRTILKGPERLLVQTLAVLVELALLLLAFAWAYQMLGIKDTSQSGSPIVHDFATSIYYSIVTFTTLGYGDIYPVGTGRALAAVEAFTGYLILGILASTGVSILSPHERPNISDDA